MATKRRNPNSDTTTAVAENHAAKNNGNSVATEPMPPALGLVLESLQTMRDGDFSVRLPGSWTGLEGKIADTFNEIVAANQQMAQELKRVGQGGG